MTCAASTAIAGAGLAVSAAGAAGSMMAAGRAGGAAGQGAGFNQMIAEQNARIAHDNAEAAKARALVDAGEIAIATRKGLGTTRANAGANGLVIEDGSPLEALLDSAAIGELNRQRRLWQGDMEARDFEMQGRGFMVDAYGEELRGYQAQQRTQGALIGGAASLLTGASKLAGMFSSGGTKGEITMTRGASREVAI